MSTIKYLVKPGFVQSKADGQFHFIGCLQLMALYHVHPNECFVLLDDYSRQEYTEDFLRSLIPLYPRYDGNYDLDESVLSE